MPKKILTASFVSTVKVDTRTEFYDSSTSGLGLRVSPTGKKSFFYRYRYKGKTKRYHIGEFSKITTLAAARNKVEEMRLHIKKGGDPQGEEKNYKQADFKTLSQALDEYEQKYLPNLKPSTQQNYKIRIGYIRKGLNPNKYIKDFERYEIIDFLDEVKKTAPVNAQRIQAILSGLFKFSKDRAWVTENIANRITLINARERERDRVYTDDEIRRLWKEFEKQSEPVQSIFKILLILGQRSGEIRKMKWADIDFKKQLWVIPKADTKAGNTHYVPLPDKAIQILEYLKPRTGNSKFVFESPVKQNSHIEYIQYASKRIRKLSKVEGFRIHDLRRTVATRMAEINTPPQVLSKILNHSTPGSGSAITAIYNRYDYAEEKRTALNRWAIELDRILTGREARIHDIKKSS